MFGNQSLGDLNRCAIKVAVVALLLLLSAVFAANLGARAGDLDPEFGEGGKVTTAMGAANGQGMATAIQSDGRVLVAGYVTQYSGANGAALVRFHQDGALDLTFGVGGIARLPLPSSLALAMVVQDDGKIVIGGMGGVEASDRRLLLARFHADGSLDATFGEGGITLTDLEGATEWIAALALQPDGKIVAGGTMTPADEDIFLARYHDNGFPDPTFAANGAISVDLGGDDYINALVLDGDGNITATGNSGSAIMLVRLDGEGFLDSAFGVNGVVMTVPASSYVNDAYAIVSEPNGKITVAGLSHDAFLLARYLADGQPDPSFGATGLVITDVGSADRATALLLQPDGKLIALGHTYIGGTHNLALARYLTNGDLDADFGVGGISVVEQPDQQFLFGAVRQEDGAILVAGVNGVASPHNLAAWRITANGLLDSYFGDAGLAEVILPGASEAAALHIAEDGKITVAGTAGDGSRADFALAQYEGNGLLNRAYGDNGIVITDFGLIDTATAMARQTDGKTILTGYSHDTFIDPVIALARFEADGALDTTFGAGGLVTTTVGVYALANGIVVQPDGKMVVAGQSMGDPILVRYEANGAIDASFGATGVVRVSHGGEGGAADLIQQEDGKLVIGGWRQPDPSLYDFDIMTARFDADGNLDSDFGDSGVVTNDFGGIEEYGRDLLAQPDGKLLVMGNSFINGAPPHFILARYNENGTLDAAFGQGGSILGDPGFTAHSLALLEDGSVVVAGSTEEPADFALRRFDADGNPYQDFGDVGRVTTDFGFLDSANALAVQEDGSMVAAGTGSQNFALARYKGDAVEVSDLQVLGSPAADLGAQVVFTASVSPPDATMPVTYTWQIDDHETLTRTSGISDTITLSWQTPGEKNITVMASNSSRQVTAHHTVVVRSRWLYVPVVVYRP